MIKWLIKNLACLATIIIAAFLLLVTTGCSGWSKSDKALFAASMVLQAVDTAQTLTAIEDGGRELNPLIGSDPSKKRLIGIAVGTAVGKYVVAHKLPKGKYRTTWLILMNVISGTAVTHNHFKSGIRINF